MSTPLRLPHFWKNMGFCAKAGYLAASGQARDFTHACSMLAKMKRGKIVAPKRTLGVARLPYKDSE